MLNMFSSDLLDKSLLLVNIENFLGTNPELFAWAKRFLKINDKPEDQVQNALRKGSKVRLSVCRSLGPSYRLLPKLVSFNHTGPNARHDVSANPSCKGSYQGLQWS